MEIDLFPKGTKAYRILAAHNTKVLQQREMYIFSSPLEEAGCQRFAPSLHEVPHDRPRPIP